MRYFHLTVFASKAAAPPGGISLQNSHLIFALILIIIYPFSEHLSRCLHHVMGVFATKPVYHLSPYLQIFVWIFSLSHYHFLSVCTMEMIGFVNEMQSTREI